MARKCLPPAGLVDPGSLSPLLFVAERAFGLDPHQMMLAAAFPTKLQPVALGALPSSRPQRLRPSSDEGLWKFSVPAAAILLVGTAAGGRLRRSRRSWRVSLAAAIKADTVPQVSGGTDGTWEPPTQQMSDAVRAIPGSPLSDRNVRTLGEVFLRRKAKLVAPERITGVKSIDVAIEMVRVMRGPKLPGRERPGNISAPQIGTPSRVIALEDPAADQARQSEEDKVRDGRLKPFGPKVIYNPRLKVVSDKKTVNWERDPVIPGYRALVERAQAVEVTGMDPNGKPVNYIARDFEARLVQQSVDTLDGLFFTDRCITRSLVHLDARTDPLPADCPPVGLQGEVPPRQLTESQLAAAEKGAGGRGLFGFGLPVGGPPATLLVGNLILRLKAKEVSPSGIGEVAGLIKDMREAVDAGKHPLGCAAPQLGRGLRIIAVGERQEDIDKLTARARTDEEHKAFKTVVIINPVVTPKAGGSESYFWERSASVPAYEGVVGRATEVEVQGLDERGTPLSFTARGWRARMIQHCTDVLDGVLYVDRMERRSFRRDKMQDELPEDVPYGVRAAKPNFKGFGENPMKPVKSARKRQ